MKRMNGSRFRVPGSEFVFRFGVRVGVPCDVGAPNREPGTLNFERNLNTNVEPGTWNVELGCR